MTGLPQLMVGALTIAYFLVLIFLTRLLTSWLILDWVSMRLWLTLPSASLRTFTRKAARLFPYPVVQR